MQNDTPPHSSSASSSSASAPTSASPSAPPPPPPPPPGISRAKLHHLCRLAALPAPQSPAAEARVLRTLAAQLHFVRAIQRVDTAGVEPLRSVRDETAEHAAETELTVESLRAAFDAEEMVGWSRRIVRRRHRRPYLPSTSKQGGPSADAGGPLAAAGAAATTTTGAFTGAGAGADASTSSSTSNSAATVAHDGATNAAEDWDVLGLAARSAGRYFVVETSAK
jgi:Asp-tRNA(Asn)/Glu-tRNA(Gln) amidotransferase C subunit